MKERIVFHWPIMIGFWLMVSVLIVGRVVYYDQIVSPEPQRRTVTVPAVVKTSAANDRYGS